MSLFLVFFFSVVPGLPLVAGLLARSRTGAAAGSLAFRAAVLAAGAAMLCVGLLVMSGPQTVRWAPPGNDAALAVALRLDAVSGVMIALITFLGAVVLSFSRRYLAGDAGQAKFFSWMILTLGAVLLVVLSGHLGMLLVAWIATSLSLVKWPIGFAACAPRKPGHVSEYAGVSRAGMKEGGGDLCGGEQLAAGEVEVGDGEQQKKPGGVFGGSAVAHAGMAPALFDDAEGELDFGAHRGVAPILGDNVRNFGQSGGRPAHMNNESQNNKPVPAAPAPNSPPAP
jgi:hypothetical protein